MSAKHTPAPWTVEQVRSGPDSKRELVYAKISSGSLIGFVGVYAAPKAYPRKPFKIPEAEALANARLIAAAPELLEMLEACIGALEEVQQQETADVEDLLRAARAAIKKARDE